MSSGPVFTITYWGTTGALAAPLRPTQVSDKVRDAIVHLAQSGRMAVLAEAAKDPTRLDQFLEQNLPWGLRSTYGGNTTCVQIQTPDALIIIDCGTGIRELGMDLEQRWNAPGYHGSREGHVIFTHAHMDHTFALPFLIRFSIREMRLPFTAPLRSSRAWMPSLLLRRLSRGFTFRQRTNYSKAFASRVVIEADKTFEIGATKVSTLGLRHPGGCLGLHFDCGGKCFVFCTDHEPAETPDPALARFAHGADLLYLDGQYLAAEYEGKAGIMSEPPMLRHGWGHGTVEACAATAVAAGVPRLHAGHREPKRDDADIARLDAALGQAVAAALARARPGLGSVPGLRPL